jgi:hypothetical protein
MLEFPHAEERVGVLEALHHEHFSVEELADVLDVSPSVIRSAVRRGDLKGFIVDHHIVDIMRADAIDWLKRRASE